MNNDKMKDIGTKEKVSHDPISKRHTVCLQNDDNTRHVTCCINAQKDHVIGSSRQSVGLIKLFNVPVALVFYGSSLEDNNKVTCCIV